MFRRPERLVRGLVGFRCSEGVRRWRGIYTVSGIQASGLGTHGSAAVSRVERPAPTTCWSAMDTLSIQGKHTNMLPQNPPKDFFTPLGQKRRHPTARVARPDGQPGTSHECDTHLP